VETIRRMARPRAKLLAALVAAGSAARLIAQGEPVPAPAVDVSAPRAVETQQMPVSPFSVVPNAVESAGFRSSLVGNTSSFQATPPAEALPPSAGPIEKPSTPTPPETSTAPQAPPMTGLPYYAPAPPIPSAAPAWRWHGYGGVITAEGLPPMAPRTTVLPISSTSPTPPSGSAVSALPAGPEANQGTDWKQPGAVPAFNTPPDVAPAALPASAAAPQPLSAGEPRWKSTGEQVAVANPMTMGRDGWVSMTRPAATPVVTVSASVPVYHGPMVTLDPPRAASRPDSRTIGDPPTLAAPVAMPPVIQPVSYAVPAPAPAPKPRQASIPSNIRPGIERVCGGRGHDLDVSVCGPSSLLVRLKVGQPADAEYLANAISRMPELAPYQVQFEMQVAR
jgi:hypothetical protein